MPLALSFDDFDVIFCEVCGALTVHQIIKGQYWKCVECNEVVCIDG